MRAMASILRHIQRMARMTRRWPWSIALALLALALGGGLLLWLSQHWIEPVETVYTGFGETARRNPFYAADRLLSRLGTTVHSVRRLADLPDSLPAADTLLMAIPTYALTAAESQRLLDWVARGGHLIIGVRHKYQPGQGVDHLLDPLQVRSHRVESTATDPATITTGDAMPPLQVRFQSELRLNDEVWRQIRWSEGQVTLLTDIDLFDNERLADHDHADFLWRLVQRPERGGEVWLQYRTLVPSLAQLLWRHAWMPLAGLILTLLATLWTCGPRLGPLLVPRSGERRRLAEHLQASSRFLWRHGAGPILLQVARQYALRRLEHRRSDAASVVVLADSDQPLNDRALVETLQTLQSIDRHRR